MHALSKQLKKATVKKITITSELEQYSTFNELDNTRQELVQQAIESSRKAYAPYSNFQVGAAVRLEDNTLVIGNNQENAAYPSGLCAERVALFAAHAQNPDIAPTQLAIAVHRNNELAEFPTPPCGSCLQVIAELEHKFAHPIEIILYGKQKVLIAKSVKTFLPLYFNKDKL